MKEQRIKNQIRRLRFEANEMTQAELAEKASVTRQTIIALEAQKYSPSLELAFRIAKVFDVPLEEAFHRAIANPVVPSLPSAQHL